MLSSSLSTKLTRHADKRGLVNSLAKFQSFVSIKIFLSSVAYIGYKKSGKDPISFKLKIPYPLVWVLLY